MTHIDIHDSVKIIGEQAFDCCYNLQEINVDNNNTKYCSIDGNLFSKDKNILYQYSIGKKDITYNVPDNVTKIGDEAFFNCTNLQYIVFPDSRTTIGNSAFNGCSSLVKIKLPNNITEIWWYAFSCCTSLKSIIIPKTITKIYDYAFNNCTTLSDVYYNGTQTEWNNIDIGTSNSYFTNANIHFIYTE